MHLYYLGSMRKKHRNETEANDYFFLSVPGLHWLEKCGSCSLFSQLCFCCSFPLLHTHSLKPPEWPKMWPGFVSVQRLRAFHYPYLPLFCLLAPLFTPSSQPICKAFPSPCALCNQIGESDFIFYFQIVPEFSNLPSIIAKLWAILYCNKSVIIIIIL